MKFSITHVGLGDQSADLGLAIGAFEIDRDRALAAVAAVEIGRAALGVGDEGRAPAARVVARAGALDLDHLGAEIGEQLSRPRPRQDARELDHPYPGERLIHVP